VRAARRPESGGDATTIDRIGGEVVDRDGGSANVDQCVDRTDFVKMNAIGRRAVHGGFGDGENGDRTRRERLRAGRETGPDDHRRHLERRHPVIV
jgi:hypothetical protein